MALRSLAGQAVVELLLRDRMTQGLHKAGAKLKAFGRMVDTVAMGMMKAGALMAIPTAVAGKTFMSFEKQMTQVATMLDDPQKHMDNFVTSIRKMSKEFGVGTDELSAGLYQILSSTIPADKALGVLEASTKASIGGITDVATATNAIVGVLKGYGMEAEKAADVSDTLFMTVKRGRTNYEELSRTIGQSIPFAKLAGVSLKELGAVLALVTVQSVQTDKAVIGIRQGLASMAKPAREANKIFTELFGETFDLSAIQKSGDFVQFLREIKKRTDELAKGPKETALFTLFGDIRAGQALLGVVDNVEGLTENMDYMANKAGAADAMFQLFNQTLGQDFKKLVQSAKDLMLELGMALADTMVDWSKSLKETLDSMTEFIANNKELVVTFAKLAVGLITGGAALKVFSVLLGIITPMVVSLGSVLIKTIQFGFLGLLKVIPMLWGVMAPMLPLISMIVAGFLLFNMVVDTGMSLFEQFATVIGIVIGALTLYKTILVIGAALTAAWTAITVVFSAVLSVLSFIVGVILTQGFGLLIGVALAAAAAFMYFFTEAGSSFDQFGKRSTKVFGEIADAGKTAYNGIVAAWQAGDMELVGKIAIKALELIWAKFWNWLKEGFASSWDAVANTAKDFVAALAMLMIKPSQWLVQSFYFVMEQIAHFFTWVAQMIEGTFMMIASIIAGTLNFITGGLIGMNSREIDNWADEVSDKYEKKRANIDKKADEVQAQIEERANTAVMGLFTHHDESAKARREQAMKNREQERALQEELKLLEQQALAAKKKKDEEEGVVEQLGGAGMTGLGEMLENYEPAIGEGFKNGIENADIPDIDIPQLDTMNNNLGDIGTGMEQAAEAISLGQQGAFGAASNLRNIQGIFGYAAKWETQVIDKLDQMNGYMRSIDATEKKQLRNLRW